MEMLIFQGVMERVSSGPLLVQRFHWWRRNESAHKGEIVNLNNLRNVIVPGG
jgi:hypothetical protein